MVEAAGGGKESGLRLVFFGTPHFAAVVLKILAGWPGGKLVGVVTQPDRPCGRGHKLRQCECAALATELGIPLYQPASLRNGEAVERIAQFGPDLMAVAAYGLLIPREILDIPPLGTINVHASLLPAYRGAAPIARAIMENWQPNAETGVSIMEVVEALDAGAVYAQKAVPIEKHTCASLTDKLAREGGELLLATLDEIGKGTAKSTPQDESLATYATKLDRTDGLIDWTKPAEEIEARIRGVYPWPVAHASMEFTGREPMPLLLHEAAVGEECAGVEPGTINMDKAGLRIACGGKWLQILKLCKPGRKETSARDFINGNLRDLPPGICGKAN